MDKFQKILKSYDLLKDDEGNLKIDKMTDEEIDKLFELENEMVLDSLPALVLFAKTQAQRRLKAEKEEEFAKVLIRRMMQRVNIENFDCDDGKVKATRSIKYDIDEEKLPQDFFMPNHASIRAKLGKDETVEWVTPTQKFMWVRVS